MGIPTPASTKTFLPSSIFEASETVSIETDGFDETGALRAESSEESNEARPFPFSADERGGGDGGARGRGGEERGAVGRSKSVLEGGRAEAGVVTADFRRSVSLEGIN